MPFSVVCLDNGSTWTPLTSKCFNLCERPGDHNSLAVGSIQNHSSQPGSWLLALKTWQLCRCQHLCILFREPLQSSIRSPVFPAIYFQLPFSSCSGFSWGAELLPHSLASWLLSAFILHACCFQNDLESLSLLGMCSAAELKSPAVHCYSGINWTLSLADIRQADEPIINHWQPDLFVYGVRKVQLCGRAASFSSCQTTSTSADAVNPTQRLLLFWNQAIGFSAFKPPLSLSLLTVPSLLPDTSAASAS